MLFNLNINSTQPAVGCQQHLSDVCSIRCVCFDNCGCLRGIKRFAFFFAVRRYFLKF